MGLKGPQLFPAFKSRPTQICQTKELGQIHTSDEEMRKNTMDEFLDVVKGRRSIRKYREEAVPEQAIEEILESVRWSPSWANTQCWEVIVVKDAEKKAELAEALGRTNPAQRAVNQAPVVLALAARLKSSGYYKGEVTTKLGDWFMFDIGIATQSLCLTAHNLGLGTVIVGMFEHDRAGRVLGIGEGYEVVVLIPLGYPDHDPRAPKRRELDEFTHYERF